MKISGIYSITNKINGKVYYGSSSSIKDRWYYHKGQLRNNKHKNTHLQNAWNKYGADSFIFKIEKEIPVEQLIDVEQTYLDIAKQNPKLYYNIGYDADCATRGMKKEPLSKETKKKLSDGMILRMKNPEIRKKLSIQHTGIKVPSITGNLNPACRPEVKEKIRLWNIGKKYSDETKKKVSLSLMGNERNHNKTIYTLKNNITGEIFNGYQKQFYKKYNLSQGNVWRMITGKSKSCKGWSKICQ